MSEQEEKRIYDQAWNQYNIYYQAYPNYSSKLNTVGAVSSVFILVLTTIADRDLETFYFPLLFFLIPFVVSLINLFYGFEIPWHNKDLLLDQASKGAEGFYRTQVDDIFKCAGTLLKYKQFARIGLKISAVSIFLGIFLSIIFLVYF